MSDLEARLREQLADIGASVTVDVSGSSRNRRNTQRLVSLVVGVLVLALAGGFAWARIDTNTHAVTGPAKTATAGPDKSSKSLPNATSSSATVRSLWQIDGLADPAVIDDQVVGFVGLGKHPVVQAVSAFDGDQRWSVALPASEPVAMGLLAAQGVVVAEIGHIPGLPPAIGSSAGPSHGLVAGGPSQGPIVSSLLVIDARDGRLLWTQSVGGSSQTPPVAIASDLVVTGDPLGTLNARNAQTGARVWRRARPAACPRAGVVLYDEGLVADGPLLAVSYQCSMPTTRRTLVERLDISSGTPVWQWSTPALAGPLGQTFAVVGAAASGATVFAAGGVPPKAHALAAALGRDFTFPPGLGTPGQSTIVAFDAGSGHPRWNEFGSQFQYFGRMSLADGAMCESQTEGFECRDDVTGALTRPVFSSGYDEDVGTGFANDGFAGISGDAAAAVTTTPSTDSVSVGLLPVRGNGRTVSVTVGISTTIFNGAHQAPFVVGNGGLSDGTTILLIRRVDVAGNPILALGVKPHT